MSDGLPPTSHAPRRRSRGSLIGVVALVAVVAMAVVAYRRSTQAAPGTAPVAADSTAPLRTVAVYPIRRRTLKKTVTLTAELAPYNVANMYAKVSGYLQSISVDYGSHVHAGESIATIELPEQQSNVERAQSAYVLAKVSYDRILSVVHQTPGMLAEQDVDNAKAAYEAAKDDRDRAQVMLDYTNIVAPFDGIVTKRNADLGDLVQEGDTGSSAMPIVQIAQESELRLVFEAPESIVPFIEIGTPAIVHIQGTDDTIRGRVARYSYDVHQETRTMHTEVDIANPDLRYKPGMYADVTLTLSDRPNVLAVPTQSLSTDGGSSVWVVTPADRIEQRDVTTGLATPNWIEVTRGLHPGDRVVLGDHSALAIGASVRPDVTAPPTGS